MSSLARDAKKDRFQRMLKDNRRRFVGIARAYAAPADWQDLYQEILLQLWRSLESFEQHSSLDTWAYRVALNTGLSHRRSNETRARHDGTAGARPEHAVSGGHQLDEQQILGEFLQSLGPVDRALLILSLDDSSYEQMSEITGLGKSNVGVRLHRVKKLFVQQYGRA